MGQIRLKQAGQSAVVHTTRNSWRHIHVKARNQRAAHAQARSSTPGGVPSEPFTTDYTYATTTDYAYATGPATPLQVDYQRQLTSGPLMGKRVFVAGATGRSGVKIVDKLIAAGADVQALVRDTNKAAVQLPSTVTLYKGDVTQMMGLPQALEGCEAVIIATGTVEFLNPLGPLTVDYEGTANIVAAAKQAGVRKIILITSIGTDEVLNPLNLAWGILFWKKRAEEEVQRSGLDYTIVRPGGLVSDATRSDSRGLGNIVMEGPGTFGTPPKRSGSILRAMVADVCVQAITLPEASNKVVEIIADPAAPSKTMRDLFAAVY